MRDPSSRKTLGTEKAMAVGAGAGMAVTVPAAHFEAPIRSSPDSKYLFGRDFGLTSVMPTPTLLPAPIPEVEVVRHAADVLGAGRVARWMTSKVPALDHQTPYSLLSTEEGRQRVEEALLRIAHGVY